MGQKAAKKKALRARRQHKEKIYETRRSQKKGSLEQEATNGKAPWCKMQWRKRY
jgi:hypothetical protein